MYFSGLMTLACCLFYCFKEYPTISCVSLSRFFNQARAVPFVVYITLRSILVLYTHHAWQYAMLIVVTSLAEHRGCCGLLLEFLLFIARFVLFPLCNDTIASHTSCIHGSIDVSFEQRQLGFTHESIVLTPATSSSPRFEHEQSFRVIITERT
jgi:hypothetical protein